ncbi:EamA family transporter [Pseudomonas sp. Marseille-Q8238]
MQITYFPRGMAVLFLAGLACAFAGNHIAARIAFDNGAGLLLAILCRSGITSLVLGAIVLARREHLRIPPGVLKWQLLAGLLLGLQSLCIFSAVARIPVGLALLLTNLSPILLALLTALLGGPAPTRQAFVLMGVILSGLLLALNIPSIISGQVTMDGRWFEGVLFGLGSALSFAMVLWTTENRLASLDGTVRSMMSTALVCLCAVAVGTTGVFPTGISLPGSTGGWLALSVMVMLYGAAFSGLFILMPRLNMARNAPVMNAEPVAGLILGWLILGQHLTWVQLIGGSLVVGGIVLLAYQRHS